MRASLRNRLDRKGSMRQSQKTDGKLYIPGLDGIRAIAFLLVFAAHAGMDKWIPGGLGVTIFFFSAAI